MVVHEVMSLAANPSQVDVLIKKEAAGDGGSYAAGVSEELNRLDGEISRLMDLLQHDQVASVGDIAERISKVHAERMALEPGRLESAHRPYDVEMAKGILYDVRYVWSSLDIKAQRSYLLQLIDGVHISDGGIRVSWSFL